MKVLVIAPHADDETFGCGGTMLRLLAEGHEVFCVVIALGTIRFDHLEGKEVSDSIRLEEFKNAMDFLGVKQRSWAGNFTDSQLDSIPMVKIISWLELWQKEHLADTWLIPGPSFHQDHDIVYRAAIAAGRPFTSFAPKNIMCYELPTYVYGPKHMTFHPNLFVDVDKFIDKKIEAVNLYKSQLRPSGSLLSTDKLRDWAATRGGQAGLKFAEAFEIVKMVA